MELSLQQLTNLYKQTKALLHGSSDNPNTGLNNAWLSAHRAMKDVLAFLLHSNKKVRVIQPFVNGDSETFYTNVMCVSNNTKTIKKGSFFIPYGNKSGTKIDGKSIMLPFVKDYQFSATSESTVSMKVLYCTGEITKIKRNSIEYQWETNSPVVELYLDIEVPKELAHLCSRLYELTVQKRETAINLLNIQSKVESKLQALELNNEFVLPNEVKSLPLIDRLDAMKECDLLETKKIKK
jgi:hypothetical protein